VTGRTSTHSQRTTTISDAAGRKAGTVVPGRTKWCLWNGCR